MSSVITTCSLFKVVVHHFFGMQMMNPDHTSPPNASRNRLFRAPSAAAAAAVDQRAAAGGAAGGIERWHVRHLQQVVRDLSVNSQVKLGSAEPLGVYKSDVIQACGAFDVR